MSLILCFQNETLIAIKAPHGTTLEVPDPDEVRQAIKELKLEFICYAAHHKTLKLFIWTLFLQASEYSQRRYRVVLRSTMGPIDVYLVR